MTQQATLQEARENTAMKDPNHLKAWLDASGRRWLVFDGVELVDALPWPDGIGMLMEIVRAYGHHRAKSPSGRTETVRDPLTKETVEVPIFKTEKLERDELDRAIRYLVRQIYDLDPDWSL